MGKGKRRGVLAFMISLVMVFGSFSLAFADENGVSESYGDGYYDGLLQDEDGYIGDEKVVSGYDEYGNAEDARDYFSQVMQEIDEIETVGFESGIVPAWSLPIQESSRISAGAFHSLVIMPDNSLWGWGSPMSLGVNGPAGGGVWLRPVWIMDNVAAVSAGPFHTLVITIFGELLAWGNNSHGQLGDGTTEIRFTPVVIMTDVKAISAGGSHSMAIKTDGSLWAWGHGGHLGDGTTVDRHSPVWIMDDVAAVSAGWRHSAAITADGVLWDLGVDREQRHFNMASVSASSDYTMAISGGSLFGWGNNCVGQLGTGTTYFSHSMVWIMDDVMTVSARNAMGLGDPGHTMAIRDDGSLWGWGNNASGQLGNGTTSNGNIPNPYPVWIMDNVAEVSVGTNHTLAITTDGYLWAWGRNWSGQLGDNTDIDRDSPVLIKSLTPTGNTPDPNINLTHYYATMTASSSFNPINTPPHHTNDNNPTVNVWRPAAPGNGYLTARFNEAKNFNQIRIYQNGNRIQDYQLKYSNDGTTWNVLESGPATPAAIATYSFGNTITAQYVRLVIGQSLNANPAAVLQFDIRYMP